jgi:lambda family phage portal protein
MNFIERFLARYGYKKRPEIKKRNIFAGVDTGRLYSSWTTTNYSADSEIYNSLRILRARARDLERNNDYAKKFLRMVKTNVIGRDGIKLQSQVKNDNNSADEIARNKIEDAFKEWSKKGACDVTGEYSFRDLQKMIISTIARDGEVIIRRVRGFDNPFRYSLQLLEADHLDERHNDTLASGNRVKMGIEFDGWSRPVAYWLYPLHPGDMLFGEGYGDKIRIAAEEIFHIFLPQRVSQTRGFPWLHSAMTRLNMLGAYEEAELVASRIAAAKGGFYTSGTGDTYTGDDTEDNNPIQEVEPGIFETLPRGWDFKVFDPQHPSSAYESFSKSILRGIASGLDVSYAYLANDLTDVNYSSIRAGVLDERDVWRDVQAFMAEHVLQPIFEEWLEMALLTQKINLPFSKLEKFKKARWQPRGWQWVDPEKDVNAKIMSIENNLETGADIAAEQGKDLEEIYQQLAIEKELKKKYGLMPQPVKTAKNGKPVAVET